MDFFLFIYILSTYNLLLSSSFLPFFDRNNMYLVNVFFITAISLHYNGYFFIFSLFLQIIATLLLFFFLLFIIELKIKNKEIVED